MLFRYGFGTPASRPIELDDDVGLVLKAEVVDAILEAGQGRAVARRVEPTGLDRTQNAVGGQLEEEFRHGRRKIHRVRVELIYQGIRWQIRALPRISGFVSLLAHLRQIMGT